MCANVFTTRVHGCADTILCVGRCCIRGGPDVQCCDELFRGRRTGFALGHSQHREPGVFALARGCWSDEANVRNPNRFPQILYRSSRQLRCFTCQIYFERNACSLRGLLGQPESQAHRFVEKEGAYHRSSSLRHLCRRTCQGIK